MIEGVILAPLKRISVTKGDIFYALKSSDAVYSGFGEAYFSEIHPKEIKGWKSHKRMTLNIIPVNGAIGFVLYDNRPGSSTYGEFEHIVLSRNNNYQRLTVPPGLWMAFYCASNDTAMLMDIIPEPHDPDEADRLDLSAIKYDFI